MSMPSIEQWDSLRTTLKSIYGSAYLRCDGYLLALNWERASKTTRRYELAIYVNGYIRGEWMAIGVKEGDEISDQAQRFYRPRRQGHARKHVASMEKIFGKRKCKKMGVYDKRVSYMPYWNTMDSCIRHLKKHNQDIQILTRDDYMAAMDPVKEDAQ